ncbi:MAG: DoxX family membrane protein, partial [Ferruginibacter sp.]
MHSLTKNENLNLESGNKIYYALRIASAMCFIGHGAFGIITKEIWTNYFGVFGIGHAASYNLMPIVGTIDILCGLIILFYPIKAFVMWLVLWGFVTALLRPMSGEAFPELIERAGNFGAPLALLIFSGGINLKNIFKPLLPDVNLKTNTLASLTIILRIVVCLLLVGHGWLNIIEKKGILSQYTSLGFSDPALISQFVGFFEIFAGLAVLIRPIRTFILVLFIWKMTTELFYPHYELFEWIERGGSYGAILALWFTLGALSATE